MPVEENMQSQTSQLKLELIRASAGAGKTHTLIEKIIYCISDYYQKRQTFPRVAVATFTRKATSELKERLIYRAIRTHDPKLIEYVSYSPRLQVSTLHGIFHLFLEQYGSHIDLSPGFTVASAGFHLSFLSILKEQLFEKKQGIDLLEHYYFYELQDIVKQYVLYVQQKPDTRPVNFREIQSDFLDKNTQQLFVDVSLQLQNLGLAVLDSWQRKKKQNAQITFNDLETMTLELIRLKTGWQFFKRDFWFLDEYQDTSLLQKNILDILTAGSRVFIVGDPQQSIYYFRGSDSSVFSLKEQEAQKRLDGTFQKQVKNYRSNSNLIAFFNDFFSNFEKMDFQKSDCNFETETARFIWIKDFGNSNQKRQAQCAEVFKQIKRIRGLLKNPDELTNIVVLARKNRILNECARYLKSQKIPVQLHSSDSFRKKREIKDALFILRFLCNPYDDENLVGLLRTPYFRLPDPDIIQLLKESNLKKEKVVNKKEIQKLALWSICLKHTQKHRVLSVLDYYFKKANQHGLVGSFQNALEDCGLLDLAYYQDPTGLREANLWKLIYDLKQYEQRGQSQGDGGNRTCNLLSFVDSLLEEDGIASEEGDSGGVVSAILSSGVQLMTIHAAKGLEFDHLILLDMGGDLGSQTGNRYFIGESSGKKDVARWSLKVRSLDEDKRISSSVHDTILSDHKQEELKETDRLLYVALTRAKKTVTLIGAGPDLEKPKKYSWIHRFSFFKKLKKPGVYRNSHYTYRYLLIDHQKINQKIDHG